MSELRFDGRVVIVTGAGNGLGRSHALAFASRGAKVVVNDLGGGRHGDGKSNAAADAVVAEIKEKGGEAVANYDSVEDGDRIVKTALDTFGRIDVVVNNAGILRDTSFHKMTQPDWDLIYRVHVLGGYRVTRAAWEHMREAGYGRVIFTASAAGIYGNFGQANYSMAKLGLVGLSNTLALEGRKRNILVNAIAPLAGSRLTETVMPPNLIEALKPEYVSPLVLCLTHESSEETGGLYEVGGGFFGKLRWQRAQGKMFKLGRPITPEQVKQAWNKIAGFEEVTYPTDVTSSMSPILANLESRSGGGNELIDVDEALSAPPTVVENSYDERDVALYALGIGAAENPLDATDLPLVYEMSGEGFRAFPTFAVIPSMAVIFEQAKKGARAPGLHFGFERILHGEQYTEVARPLPVRARLKHEAKTKEIYDKGRNAVVVTAITTRDADNGEQLAYNELTTVVRGAGGWGGDRGPNVETNVAPARAPDAVVTEKTHENQALLYRLSGDINPLHVDPGFAQAFGFDRPILHGLCTFGFAARAAVKAFAPDRDARYFKSIKARFTESVFPGETLVTEMWKESPTRVVLRTRVKERDKVVISNAAVELYPEIPKPKAKESAKAPAAQSGAASAEPVSADIFEGIRAYFGANAEAVKKIGVVYQFKLSNPDSAWTLDTKTATVAAGESAPPECTLSLGDADFMAMCTGKADAMKLFMDKKLKIAGNLMASQKLEFLKKIDPQLVMDSARRRAGGGATAAAPVASTAKAPAPAPPVEMQAPRILAALGRRLAESPGLAREIGATIQLVVDGKSWVIEGASVREGTDPKAVKVALSDADLVSLAKGECDARHLFMHGQLRAEGDARVAQRLAVLKGLI